MSSCQSFLLLAVRYTLKVLVLIFHPNTTFTSEGKPSAKCLVWFMMDVRWVASFGEGGWKRHSRASGTAWVILRRMSSFIAPAMKMSSIKLSVMMSRGGRVTIRGSAAPKGVWVGSRVGVVSKKGKLDVNVDVSQVGSKERSKARSVALSLMMLKSAGAGADPKGRRVSKYAILARMVMQVTAACIAVWILL